MTNKYATIANLNLKQDILNVTSPFIKDVSNDITIDLSAYALNLSLNASNVTAGTLPVSDWFQSHVCKAVSWAV